VRVKPRPEPWDHSLDNAFADAWLVGFALLAYWLYPHLSWWQRLVQVLVFLACSYGLRRLTARRRQARDTYWAELHRGGVVLQVESSDPRAVEDTVRSWHEQSGDQGGPYL